MGMRDEQKSQPTSTRDRCSARFHLRGSDFAVYDACQQLTRGGVGQLTASRDTLARKTSYNFQTISRSRGRLIKAGWLEPVERDWLPKQRRSGADGRFKTPAFRVVQHDDWAKAHPGNCASDDTATVYALTVHGESVHGDTVCGHSTDTVHGDAHLTVHGETRRYLRSEASNIAEKEEATASAASDFRNPKIDDPVQAVIEEMQTAYRKRWNRGFALPVRTKTELAGLVAERGSETILEAFSVFIADDADEFLTENRHPLASFVKRIEVYIRPATPEAATQELVEFEGKMIPGWLRDEKLKEREEMAERKKKREQKEADDRAAIALQEQYEL